VVRLVRGARILAWILLVGSIAIGTATRSIVDPRLQRTSGPYTIFAGDFHVHSFPGDGGLLPWDIAGEARRRGLDVIALTNHNSLWSWRLAQWIGFEPRDIIVLPGVEMTSAGYHMAAVDVRAPIPWRQSPAQAVAAIHALGGIAIAAHPRSPRWSKWDDAAIDLLDGFEAASSNDTVAENAAFTRRAAVRRPSIAAIGSSDFHYFAPIGVSRTFLFVTERSIPAVLDAIRRGRTVACDGLGFTYGPAELASAVSAECRRIAGDPEYGRWSERFSMAGAWLGVVLLVALGAREPRTN
jgi:hypothetical protein